VDEGVPTDKAVYRFIVLLFVSQQRVRIPGIENHGSFINPVTWNFTGQFDWGSQ
jgi:hypothetical protein